MVSLKITTKLDTGLVVEEPSNEELLTFKVGSSRVLERFNQELLGLSKGAKKSFVVPCEEAHGAVDEVFKPLEEKTN